MDNLKDIKLDADVEGLELYSDQYPFRLPLRVKSFESEGDYTKFIRNCERQIRNSIEYKQWKNYIIDVLGIQSCMITNERIDQCSIEVHHHMPSLFILVKGMINKKIDNEEEFSTFDIALDAIEYHFQNKIGYVTLIKSMHEKFHNGFLNVPYELVKGNYTEFIKEYSQYLDDDDIDTINKRLTINESNCGWSKDNYPAESEETLEEMVL